MGETFYPKKIRILGGLFLTPPPAQKTPPETDSTLRSEKEKKLPMREGNR